MRDAEDTLHLRMDGRTGKQAYASEHRARAFMVERSLWRLACGVYTTFTLAFLHPSMELALTSWHISSTTASGIMSSRQSHSVPHRHSMAVSSGTRK